MTIGPTPGRQALDDLRFELKRGDAYEQHLSSRIEDGLDAQTAAWEQYVQEEDTKVYPMVTEMARAVLSMADSGDMPDAYWTSDTRIVAAREVLGVPVDGRYTHAHLWEA